MKAKYICALVLACVIPIRAQDIAPVLTWDVIVTNYAARNFDLRRGETVVLAPVFKTSSNTYLNLAAATSVALRYRAPVPRAPYYTQTGTVYAAGTGEVRVRWAKANETIHDQNEYEIVVISPSSVLARAFGRFQLNQSVSGGSATTNNPDPTIWIFNGGDVTGRYPRLFLTGNITNAIYERSTNDAVQEAVRLMPTGGSASNLVNVDGIKVVDGIARKAYGTIWNEIGQQEYTNTILMMDFGIGKTYSYYSRMGGGVEPFESIDWVNGVLRGGPADAQWSPMTNGLWRMPANAWGAGVVDALVNWMCLTGYVAYATASNTQHTLIPEITETFDLGSPEFRWRDLYLSGSTINISDGSSTTKLSLANIVTTNHLYHIITNLDIFPQCGTSYYSYVSGWASNAGYASTAQLARTAGTAEYARVAGTAEYARVAGTAEYARVAGTAEYARVASTSVWASGSGTSAVSGKAETTDFAENAGFATYSGQAGAADSATEAGYAVRAGTSYYAVVAGTSHYAVLAGYAPRSGTGWWCEVSQYSSTSDISKTTLDIFPGITISNEFFYLNTEPSRPTSIMTYGYVSNKFVTTNDSRDIDFKGRVTLNGTNIVEALASSWGSESNTVMLHVTDGHGINQWGGFNGGIGADGRAGGAIGKYAVSDTGGAIGSNAYTLMGGAIGTASTSTYGGAVGAYSITRAGGSVGNNTISLDGFSGGSNAQATNEAGQPINAIQLGEGVNTNPNTFQVYNYPMMDANGNIYLARQSNMLSVVDALAINPKFVTTEISAELGNEIVLNRRNFVTVNNSVDLDPRFEDADVDAAWRLSILEESSTYALLQGYTDVYNDTNGVDPDNSFNAWYATNHWYRNDTTAPSGGGALYFDGTDDYATNLVAYDWTNYTWCFWWKPDADEADAQLLIVGAASAGISQNGNADLTHFQYPGTDLGLSDYQFVNNTHEFGFDGNWHFIAVSRDATLGENYLYYDGVTNGTFLAAGSANAGPYLNCPPLKLAADGSIFAKGTFDEMILFDNVKSKSDLDTIHNGGDGLYYDAGNSVFSGALAVFHFDDAAGSVATDSLNGWSFVFGDGVSPTWTTGTKAMPTGDSYVTNMVIVSQPMGLPFVPSNVAVYACVRDVSITNFVTNTDALAFISCDGKTNWTPVTYSRESMLPNGDRKLFGIADVNSLSTNVYVMYRYTNQIPVRHKRSAVIGGK